MATYHGRKVDAYLKAWKESSERKPLLLRGARQVGKTSAVRHLSESFDYFAEVDLNERNDLHYLFDGIYSPQEICRLLSVHLQVPITAGSTLLFLDEVQACPQAINRLRYFYERYPELHVIAAGSLLEFALEALPSYGVGRIRSIFMYPFSFEEYLSATGNVGLAAMIKAASPYNPLPSAIHEQALRLLRIFLVMGGMPAVVARYCEDGDMLECQNILSDLIISFRDDFTKYRRRVPSSRIDAVFRSVAEQGQGKFVFTHVNAPINAEQARAALDTLIMAGLVYPVTHTSANGIPLGAEINEKYRRMVMCDTGLLQRILGLNLSEIFTSGDMRVINSGAIAETFVATELVKAASCYAPQPLYCWHREKPGSNAEVDYVVQVGSQIYPIEVKAGVRGSMQSMRIFLQSKGLSKGIRTSMENFGALDDTLIYPLYAIASIREERRVKSEEL